MNLQNIPSDEGFRYAFDVKPGYKIVNADYSGQEQIILANKSKDKDLIYFYENDLGDMHSYISAKLFPKLIGTTPLNEIKIKFPNQRNLAKAAGFAINYGGNGYTISKNLGIPQLEGDIVYNAYFKAFPGLKNYFNEVQKKTLLQGYINIDSKTERKFFYYKSSDSNSIKRKALNYPIQGEAGSITKLAGILFRKFILQQGLENCIYITNLVHDEINVEVKEQYAKLAAEKLEYYMEEAGKVWCKIVPLKAKAKIVDYWTH